MLTFPINTERLELRPFRDSDVEAMHAVYGNPNVMTYVGFGNPIDEVETAAWLDEYRRHQELYGIGFWAVVERETGVVIGDAGFDFRVNGTDVSCELGYTIGEAWWGKGYATEVAAACIEVAFTKVGVPRIRALVDASHPASAHVLGKVGFARAGEVESYDRPDFEYWLEGDDWSAKTGQTLSLQTHPLFQPAHSVDRMLQLVDHPNGGVRFGVAMQLPWTVDNVARPDVVAALVELTTDIDEDARDWACFGLGLVEADTPVVRDALVARLTDAHNDTRCEALSALAKLRDERVIEPLMAALDKRDIWTLELEAASLLADPRLYPALIALREGWGDENDDTKELDRAIQLSHPDARPKALVLEQQLLHRVMELKPETVEVVLEGQYPDTVLNFDDGTNITTGEIWYLFNPTDGFDVEERATQLTKQD